MLLSTQLMHSQSKVEVKINNDSLQVYLENTIEKYPIPGVSVAFISSDTTLNLAVAGIVKLGERVRIDTDCKMHLGSCSKAMTGFLAGILVEKGLLQWNSTIADIFPSFLSNIQKAYRKTTLKQLLSHQSTLPPFVTGEDWISLERFTEQNAKKRRHDFAQWVLQQKPVSFDKTQKKAGFRYSNAGYAVAAAMMEEVTNKSWEELMEEEVFAPLGIEATFGWPSAENNEHKVWGHLWDEKTQILVPTDPNGTYQIDPILSPAGNISMSVLDYSKFIQKNLRGLNGLDDEYDTSFYEYLHYVNKATSEYSIGWYSVNQFEDELSSHTGSADTFYCLNLILRKHNLAVMVIANSATEETKIGVEKIRNYLIRPYLIKE